MKNEMTKVICNHISYNVAWIKFVISLFFFFFTLSVMGFSFLNCDKSMRWTGSQIIRYFFFYLIFAYCERITPKYSGEQQCHGKEKRSCKHIRSRNKKINMYIIKVWREEGTTGNKSSRDEETQK